MDDDFSPAQQAPDNHLLIVHLVHVPVLMVPVEAVDMQLLLRTHAAHSGEDTCKQCQPVELDAFLQA
jgi:hypothetical protein